MGSRYSDSAADAVPQRTNANTERERVNQLILAMATIYDMPNDEVQALLDAVGAYVRAERDAAFAEDMARGGYFSHTGRDGSNVIVRARAAGCQGRGYFAENIAWGQRSAQDAFNGWAASSGHRANMLGQNYGAYGLGQASGYWVLMFADGC